ncbi:MAG TPA: tetratricopeptide repeat protein [Acidobacteriaceae bacterium]|jgi:tetratricopeptide (TPR) repeat protein
MLRFLAIAGTVLLLSLPAAAQQQDNAAPAQQQSQAGTKDQQKKPEKKKSASDANPFPEAQSQKAAEPPSQQQDSSVPSAPEPAAQKNQNSTAKKPTTADRNPFPEAESEKAAHRDQDQGEPSSDDPNYSSSQVHVKGMDLAPSNGDEDEAPIQASSPLPYDPKLAKKDAQIGDFYLETGDFKGAYDRFVEAARSDPGNAEAVWGLAESAHHLQRNDVAIKNYRLYLAALPNGPHAKEIRRELKGMGLEPGS